MGLKKGYGLNGKGKKDLLIKPVRENLLPNSRINTLRFEIDTKI